MQLHEKRAKDGLACVSVSLDKLKGRTEADAQSFLDSKNAEFSNYFLQDPITITEKWDFGAIPLVRVYDRDGNKAGDFRSYDEVMPVVDKLLANGK